MDPSKISSLISPELLKALDQLFPNVQPKLTDTDRQVWVRVGNRQVIEFLHHKLTEDQDELPTILRKD